MEDSRDIRTSYLQLPHEFVEKIPLNQVFIKSLSAFKLFWFFAETVDPVVVYTNK